MSDLDLNDGFDSNDINNPDFGDDGEKKKSEVKAISNASQALQIAQRLVRDDEQRDWRRARNLAAFNGEAPYCDKDLVNKGQAYRYNVSFGFMEGVIGRGVVPYNELTLNLDNLASVEAELPEDKIQILREEFVEILKEWGKWSKFISRLNQELVLNGYCSPIFPNIYDPWPIFIAQKDSFVHEGSPNAAEDVEVFVWRKKYLIHELYQKIEDSEAADKAGWHVENVRKALMAAKPTDLWYGAGNERGSWTAVESAIRGGALFSSLIGAKMIETYHVFATEITGEVTHYIVLNNISLDGTAEEDDGDGVELFKKEKRFDSMRDLLVYFDLEAGDGNWHGSRGLAQRSFNTHRAIDKLRCSVLDQAFASGLTILQPGDQVSQDDFQLTVMGPFAVIPAGIQIASTTVPAVSGTTFQADQLLNITSEQRIGDVVPSVQSQLGGDKTATEARISASRAAQIGRGNLQRYLDPLSQVLSIMIRKLIKINSPNKFAKRFQERLKKRGVSSEDLKKIRSIRSTGRIDDALGDTAGTTQVAFAEFRGDPDVDQLELKRKRLGSLVGPKEADDLIIPEMDKTRVIESDRMQREEIATMITGIPIPASPRDVHEVHLKVGLDWLAGQAINQGQGRPGAAMAVLESVSNHLEQHLKFLAADPIKKALAKTVEKDFKEIVDRIADIQKAAQEIAARNAQIPQPTQPPPEQPPIQ